MKVGEAIKPRHLAAAVFLALVAALLQHAMGRVWWCECGQLNLWAGEIFSRHNSQHLIDPYTFTHILHGIGLYALVWLIARKFAGHGMRFVLAMGLESGWEVIENTKTVIERYRANTISLGYYGDSIVNSLGDIATCASGYALALWLPLWLTILIVCALEAALLCWIRDSLFLNILMLVYPVESIREWQGGASVCQSVAASVRRRSS